MDKNIHLGDCQIRYGKTNRNNFIYDSNNRIIHIDFDSDYELQLKINLKNPKKALEKAKKIVQPFLNQDTTIDELVKAGFEHNIPDNWKVR